MTLIVLFFFTTDTYSPLVRVENIKAVHTSQKLRRNQHSYVRVAALQIQQQGLLFRSVYGLNHARFIVLLTSIVLNDPDRKNSC